MRLSPVAAAVLVLVAAAPALAQDPPLDPAPVVAFAPVVAPDPAELPPSLPEPAAVVAPAPSSPFTMPGNTPAFAPLPAVTFAPASAPAGPRDEVTPAEPRSERGFQLDVGFGTEVPISVGGVLTAEVPGRVLFQLGLGVMPHGYAYAIDGLLTSVGAYDQAISNVVRNSLGSSFVLRASAGWRPFSGHGLEIMGGYTLMTMGGQTTAADVINAVLAEGGSTQRVPSGVNADIPLAATLHNVHVSLGWRWLLADDHLVIRASASYIQCVSADVGVNLASMGTQAMAMESTVNQGLNGLLSPYFTRYAKAPTLGLSAAYRF